VIRIITTTRLRRLEESEAKADFYMREISMAYGKTRPEQESNPWAFAEAQNKIKFLEARLASYQKLAGIKLEATTLAEQIAKEES